MNGTWTEKQSLGQKINPLSDSYKSEEKDAWN